MVRRGLQVYGMQIEQLQNLLQSANMKMRKRWQSNGVSRKKSNSGTLQFKIHLSTNNYMIYSLGSLFFGVFAFLTFRGFSTF